MPGQSTSLTLLLLLCSLPLAAATVYRSVGENGVVEFSDTHPADAPFAQKLHIDTPAPQPDGLQQQHLEEMRKTTDRMAADRMAREKHRAELRELETRSLPHGPRTEPETIYIGGYRSGGRSHFPGYGVHPRPRYPLARPPLRPEAGRPSAGHPTPGFNDYPASLIRRHYDPRAREAFSTPRP
tara:strand:- start:13673 stop:14221 length:549 start_codon:yes stop_codon:yes gene_type:complete